MSVARIKRGLYLLLIAVTTSYCTNTSDATTEPPPPPPPPPDDQVLGPIVSIDAATRFQTINGWEATAQAGQDLPGFSSVASRIFDMAVNDLGITRLRLEIYAGVENDRDYYTESIQTNNPQLWTCTRYANVNDNSDPFTTNNSRFFWTMIDDPVTRVVLPMKQRLEARGERLFVNVTYVAFASNPCTGRTYLHNQNPEEYAEFVVATYRHLRDRFGITPDSWELILEPSETVWTGDNLGRAAAAAASRLRAAGFTPRFIAPSRAFIQQTFPYFDQVVSISGVQGSLYELAYHRYGGATDAQLTQVADRARALGISTSMLEHISSDFNDLHKDLKVGNVSSWQQFALAYNEPDDGSKYIRITESNGVEMTRRARFLRQYFRYVRPGAVRVRATSADASFDPVAFINANGKYVVVIKSGRQGVVSLQQLPAGSYAISYALTDRSDVSPAQQLTAGRTLNVTVPGAGVITIAQQ